MGTIIYLIVSLLLAVFSFYVLYSGKLSFLRIPCWILLYLSAAVIAKFWLNFFFPEMSHKGSVTELAVLGKMCFILCIAAGFFLWIYLTHKNGEISLDKITKSVSGFIVILSAAFILSVSIFSSVIRADNNSKLVTANITQKDIFPDRLITESITQSDIFPKVEPSVIIGKGGSLCGSLHMTKKYALQFAKFNNLKYHYQGDKLIVLIQPGDEFMPIGALWTPVKKK